jgi:hypothetical protein
MRAFITQGSLALLLTAMVACAASHNFDAPGHARIEFRFADDSPGEGTTPARVKGAETEIHLRSEVLFSNNDIASVEELRDAVGRAAIGLEFTDAAAKRLAEVTGKNKGKKLA